MHLRDTQFDVGPGLIGVVLIVAVAAVAAVVVGTYRAGDCKAACDPNPVRSCGWSIVCAEDK